MNEPKEQLFVYGTLLEARVQENVFGRSVQGVPDTLPGYRKTERSVLGTYPGLEPASQVSVSGLRLSLSREWLTYADAYEGGLYSRALLPLGSGVMAWVYLPAEIQGHE